MGYLLAQSDSRRIPLADGCVHMVATSPPYFGLRSYLPKDSKVKHLEMGLEASIEDYVATQVAAFRDVRRVLRDDGTCWVNYGDSFASVAGKGKNVPQTKWAANSYPDNAAHRGKDLAGVKPKDLIGVPWRVALALQADGWYLRRDIIWSKLNPMPESVTDRPSSAHEYIFLLAKSPRYFYDKEAIEEPFADDRMGDPGDYTSLYRVGSGRMDGNPTCRPTKGQTGRNKRSVWECPAQPTREAHFATWPRRLVEPMVKAGTSEMGCCPACGTPWHRVVERRPMVIRRSGRGNAIGERGRTAASGTMVSPPTSKTKGWESGCKCGVGLIPVPPVVLDPFCGSGTTLEVARLLGRYAIGLDLSGTYLHKIARRRARRGERPHENEAVRPRIVPLSGQMSFLGEPS